jgi:hypothetical protein
MVTDVVLCRSGPRLESLCRGLDDSRSVAGSARLVARCTLGKSNKGIDTTVTTGKPDQRGTIEGTRVVSLGYANGTVGRELDRAPLDANARSLPFASTGATACLRARPRW